MNSSDFENYWPEKHAELEARHAAARPAKAPAGRDEAAIMATIRANQAATSRGLTLMKAIEALLRANPQQTVAWLEESFKTAPDIT